MILSLPDALTTFAWVARRYRRLTIVDAPSVAGALLRAELLAAGDPAAEPAAVFYAFAETRSAFPGA